ncbi:MAG: transporter substrate-binding domain-containing protein [Oscillospiraceae bacterium]|nr:transporter substrate-binding domain-containing protein [Oscillospiraceae bacterium]
MAKTYKNRIAAIITALALLPPLVSVMLSLSGCETPIDAENSRGIESPFASFRDIPEVTQSEIAAIEELQRKYTSLSFGMIPSTELFYKSNGEHGGYSVFFCEWLTQLFGIEFIPKNLSSFEIAERLDKNELDFTGNMMATPERRLKYHLTDPIAERQFITVRITGSPDFAEILAQRPLKFVFIQNTPLEEFVAAVTDRSTYEASWVTDYVAAYEMLKSGEADAFIAASIIDAYFIDYEDVVIENYFPLIFNPVSMATGNDEFEAIISVIDKALQSGALPYLAHLYTRGEREYRLHKIERMLTDDERAYIAANPVIPVAAFNVNYPLSFYNPRENQWDGIYFDLLKQVTHYTGLKFEVAHDEHANFGDLLRLLESGAVRAIPSLARSPQREETNIWSQYTIIDEYAALISKADFPKVTINEIHHVRVGVAANTSHARMFREWFPHHTQITEFDGIDGALEALKNDDVDMVMTGSNRVLHLTHFQELPGYKINRVFGEPVDTQIAFTRDEVVLRSIVDKVFGILDVEEITSQWTQRTYDYRAKVIEAQRPWLIGLIVLLFLIFVLVVIILITKSGEGARLKTLIDEKTWEAREAEDNMRIARDFAEDANRSKSIFLANMSHEIRTPMNSIIGFSELASDDDISAKTSEYLKNISDNAKWLLNIVNDILDSAKIESGRVTLEQIPFDLQDVIEQCRMAIEPQTDDKGIALLCGADSFSSQFEEQVGNNQFSGDPVRLRQIFSNLLSNAVKFTDSGTIKLNVALIERDDRYARVRFAVKDSGIGMSEEQVDKIFKPFIQADESVTRRFGGTGLGLTIAKDLIELMGGVLTVKSTQGQGSEFSFELMFDLVDSTRASSAHKIMLSDLEKPNFCGEVLVCEDNALNRQVICEHLKRVGLETAVAFDGKQGVDMVAQRMKNGEKTFDLIFMDIHMPVMDGLEATREIFALGVETPIVALTANIMAGDLELYKNSGIVDYLGKPFTSQVLWRCLLKYFTPVSVTAIDSQNQSKESEQLMEKAMLSFAENNQEAFEQIKAALEGGDVKAAHRITHSLKSNAAQIEKNALRKAAAQAEEALAGGSNLLTQAQLNALETELKAVLTELAPLAEKHNSREIKQITDKAAIHEILARLEPMLRAKNPGCEDMLDEVQSIPGSENLVSYMKNYNFKEALQALEELSSTHR